MKGILPEQLEMLDCQIILGNTYHLGVRPVITAGIYSLMKAALLLE